ncbi:MAG: hypothetical protein LBE34_02040 [Flavobacteriaceae bacterium]|jgi:hypothetical protein|nr:hypothetical protein [Flavobacteriaceae bacterium]
MNKKYLDLIYREAEFIKSKDKKFEFHHLVKAISKLDNVNLKEAIEEPDFILDFKGISIGIEIITLVNFKKRERSGFIQNVLDKISYDIAHKYSTQYLLTIYFYDDIKFDKTQMFEECKKVIEYYLENNEVLANDFIENILNCGRKRDMKLLYNPGGFLVPQLTEDILNSFVDKKNQKIKKYKENLNGNDCWLLLVTSTNEYQYDLYDSFPPRLTIKHDFDKVLLLHDFNNLLFEWNKNKWKLI